MEVWSRLDHLLHDVWLSRLSAARPAGFFSFGLTSMEPARDVANTEGLGR